MKYRQNRLWSGRGLASFMWLLPLGQGARSLDTSVRETGAAWRILDAIIGLVMSLIALGLILRLVQAG